MSSARAAHDIPRPERRAAGRPPQSARALATMLAGVALIPALALAACGSAQTSPTPRASATESRAAASTATSEARCNPGSGIPAGARLASVDMASASEGWIVGSLDLAGTCGLILRYHNGRWAPVNAPASAGLSSVKMVSAAEGWAVGRRGLILHYSGGTWTPQTSPVAADLTSVDMVSAADGWIAGAGTLLRYNAGQWQPAGVPPGTILYSVSMVSAADGWAVGINQGNAPNAPTGIILHYDGSRWTQAHFPQSDPSFIYALARVRMVSADEGWVVGVAYNGAGDHHGVILHFDGSTWTPVANPSVAGLSDISVFSATQGWAVGDFILRYSGGVWTALSSPASGIALAGVRMVSADEGWAVGAQSTILHYQSGNWSIYRAG